MLIDTMDNFKLRKEMIYAMEESAHRRDNYFAHHKKEFRLHIKKDRFSSVYIRTFEHKGTMYTINWEAKNTKTIPIYLGTMYTILEYKNFGKCVLVLDNSKISLLTPHFLKRYRERFLKNTEMSYDEVIRYFLFNQKNLSILNIPVMRDLPEINEEENFEMMLIDGAVLGTYTPDIYIFKTFISEEEIRSNKDQINLSMLTDSSFSRDMKKDIDTLNSLNSWRELGAFLGSFKEFQTSEELREIKDKYERKK